MVEDRIQVECRAKQLVQSPAVGLFAMFSKNITLTFLDLIYKR